MSTTALLPCEGVGNGEACSLLSSQGAAAAVSSRPWSWSWAWTPPAIPATPEERAAAADLERLAEKFGASSRAISSQAAAGMAPASLHATARDRI